jgi:hypothetical protein
MSRTDVHRPFWVQTRDPGMRRLMYASHDHWTRDGRSTPCTLGDPDGLCRWWPYKPIFCGCWMCTTTRQARRRTHHAARARTRSELARVRALAAAGEFDDADIPPPRRDGGW